MIDQSNEIMAVDVSDTKLIVVIAQYILVVLIQHQPIG